MTEFYVYGLIDPRTDLFFYIGKGKGKRHLQHVNEKEDVNSNTEKLKIIREIKNSNLEIRYDIIAENLSEEASYLLERLIIYKIGRKIFDEGYLTNITPGGKWHKDASLFINKKTLPSYENIESNFPEIVDVLNKFSHQAIEFTGLNCSKNPNDKNLYVFDSSGDKIHTWDVDYFIQIFGLSSALDLINIIKNISRPIYAWNRAWCKSDFENLIDFSKIPFQDFDVIDIEFVKDINYSISKSESKIIECNYESGNIQAQVKLEPNQILLTYYYPNNIIKHITQFLENKLNGKCQVWYETGILKSEIDYNKNKILLKKTYHPSGNIETIIEYTNDGLHKCTKMWYDNGQIYYQNEEEGNSFSYSETGVLITKGVHFGDINNGGYVLIHEFYDNGQLKKETKNYYVNNLLHGYQKTFFISGELRREVDYTNGFQDKVTKTFTKSGIVTKK